jgi:hypothetical protein
LALSSECSGAQAVSRLIAEYGGTRLYVPIAPNAELVEVLRQVAATQLSALFGGSASTREPNPSLEELQELREQKSGGRRNRTPGASVAAVGNQGIWAASGYVDAANSGSQL